MGHAGHVTGVDGIAIIDRPNLIDRTQPEAVIVCLTSALQRQQPIHTQHPTGSNRPEAVAGERQLLGR